MADITILTEAALRHLVPLDLEAVACVEDAFHALATKPVVMPPILRLDIAEARGEVDVKTAYVPGLDSFAIKISPGFFDNPKLGLPSLNGLMVLFSARTGLTEALLLDNGYLTDIRTAAAGAVAARHLARRDARHNTGQLVGAVHCVRSNGGDHIAALEPGLLRQPTCPHPPDIGASDTWYCALHAFGVCHAGSEARLLSLC